MTDRWQKWIRGEINKAQDALIEAIGRSVGQERHATALRFTETERRLGELEARLAELEAPQAAPTGAGSSLRVVSGGQP